MKLFKILIILLLSNLAYGDDLSVDIKVIDSGYGFNDIDLKLNSVDKPKKRKIWILSIDVWNNSKKPFDFHYFSCSWIDFKVEACEGFHLEGWTCFGNATRIQTMKPGSKISLIWPAYLIDDLLESPCELKLGIHPYRGWGKKYASRKKIIRWSNTVTITDPPKRDITPYRKMEYIESPKAN